MLLDERLITSCKLINVQRMTRDGDTFINANHLAVDVWMLIMRTCSEQIIVSMEER
jgi:hypothetical protein